MDERIRAGSERRKNFWSLRVGDDRGEGGGVWVDDAGQVGNGLANHFD